MTAMPPVANSALIELFPLEVLSDPGFDSDTGWLYQNAFYKGVNFITQKVSPITLLQGMQDAAEALPKRVSAIFIPWRASAIKMISILIQ